MLASIVRVLLGVDGQWVEYGWSRLYIGMKERVARGRDYVEARTAPAVVGGSKWR